MKLFCTALLCLFTMSDAFCQKNQLDDQLEKAYTYIKENKFEEADKYVTQLLDKNPDYGDGWDLLAKIRYQLYNESLKYDDLLGNITVTTKDKKGKKTTINNDSLANELKSMLNELKPSQMAYNKFTYAMRKGTAFSRDAYNCSANIRILNIDVVIDSDVNRKALGYFNEAEKEFEQKNYNKAAMLYQRAIEEQPNFYKAGMYLGDCYYFTENYTDAIKAFKSSSDKFPFALEPRKYLVDAYGKLSMYDKAVEEAINTMTVYPDHSMMIKMEDAAYLNHQSVKIKWTPRGVLPNTYTDTTVRDRNKYTDDIITPKGPWAYYVTALNKIMPYSNKKGILRTNQLTTSQYMEVFSWEEMLKNSTDPSLDEARKMQELGYLDCYALVSCFHYDLYPQYRDFVANNKDKIVRYYKNFVKYR